MEPGGSQNAWNLLAGGAYYLAGGGPCIAMDAGTNSPLVGSFAPSAGSRLFRAEWRHLLRRVKVWGKWRDLREVTPCERARELGPMGGCGATSTVWRRYG